MRRIYLSLVGVLIVFAAHAQNGSITGAVTDAKTGEAIIGANVSIQGTQVGDATDLDGKFTINNVKPGTYTLVVSFITYKTHNVPDVAVESAKITTVTVQMQEDATELAEIIVQGTREINTDFALINAIRDSKLVVSGISAEQIIRVPDRDAAQIMQRVPGVSIVDNRFVMIRGVNERYNQVMINRAIGPSTEVDRRSFSFDLIPSGAIDQILIYKSGAPELPGDFAGGVIQVNTKQASDENYFKFETGLGYRVGTTFNDFSRSDGSSTDRFGFDNGYRALPSGFPTSDELKNSSRTSSLREQAGKSLTNNFDYATTGAPMDFGVKMEFSQNFKIRGMGISTLNSIGYTNSYLQRDVKFNRYIIDSNVVQEERFNYDDSYFENNVRISAISNWAVKINNKNKIEFKNLFNLLGEDQTIIRAGQDFFLSADDRYYLNYAYRYNSRFIYSGQLQGTHDLGQKISAEWLIGYNFIDRDEPDFRRFRTFRLLSSGEEGYQMQMPPSSNPFDAGRFYSTLTESGVNTGLNLEKKFGNAGDKRAATIKAGYYVEVKQREFNARYISYLYPGFFDQAVGEELIRLPLSTIFAPENIKALDGFVIEEGTRASDRYTGNNTLIAGYLAGSLPIGKFDLSGGVRIENNKQELNSQNDFGPIVINNPIVSVLPFINTAYNLNDLSLLRFTYSRTVNRPEFRELAPFFFYNFELDMGIYGNETLKTADIDNIDLRYELYPNPGELISFGVFYKSFKNPIETRLQLTTENPQATFANADKAVAYGAEFEFRKSLAGLGVSRFLRNLSVNLNASYIFSEVDLGEDVGFQNRKRQLQGQSPYLINLGLFYTDEDLGFSTSVAYNVFGERIFQVGDNLYPSIYELPRNSLDFQIAKRFGRFEGKFTIQNLLNAEYRFYQDTDQNITIDVNSEDAPIMRYKIGQQLSASLAYKISR